MKMRLVWQQFHYETTHCRFCTLVFVLNWGANHDLKLWSYELKVKKFKWYFYPFRLCIHDDKVRFPIEWTTVINMYSLPGSVWPNPGVVWSKPCFAMRSLANFTIPHYLFDISQGLATGHVNEPGLSYEQFQSSWSVILPTQFLDVSLELPLLFLLVDIFLPL